MIWNKCTTEIKASKLFTSNWIQPNERLECSVSYVSKKYDFILWGIDLLLGKDLKTNQISDQFLSNGKVNMIPQKQAHITQLQWKRGCFLCDPCWGAKKKTTGAIQFTAVWRPGRIPPLQPCESYEVTKREVLNLRQSNMVASPMGLGPQNDCAGER
jgi:hypothetical protein